MMEYGTPEYGKVEFWIEHGRIDHIAWRIGYEDHGLPPIVSIGFGRLGQSRDIAAIKALLEEHGIAFSRHELMCDEYQTDLITCQGVELAFENETSSLVGVSSSELALVLWAKHLDATIKRLTQAGPTTLKNALQKAAVRSKPIFIDATNVPLTIEQALAQIERAAGSVGDLAGRVTVLTAEGVVNY